MKDERDAIEEDAQLDFRRFRRVRLRYTFDASPTGADVEYMKSRGSEAFRVLMEDLLSTQCYVNEDTVRKYMWQVRSRGVGYLALPNVELADGRLVVVDGYHRIEALRRLGRKSVVVHFHPSYWR